MTVASTRWERLRGLLGRPSLPPGTGLLIPGATAVHSLGMRFPIEVAWLDDALHVVEVRVLPPGRLTVPRPRARHVLECPVGTGLRPGERLVPVAVEGGRPGRGRSRDPVPRNGAGGLPPGPSVRRSPPGRWSP